jgi:biotin carboxyl carrier protein
MISWPRVPVSPNPRQPTMHAYRVTKSPQFWQRRSGTHRIAKCAMTARPMGRANVYQTGKGRGEWNRSIENRDDEKSALVDENRRIARSLWGGDSMKLVIALNGRDYAIDFSLAGTQVRGTIDGDAFECDAVQVSRGVYSVLIDGFVFDVRVELSADRLRINTVGCEYSGSIHDPRQWRRRDDSAVESQGRQKVTAPMPGKVVRLLVSAGEQVEVSQGLVVVEAMKMQNEVRSPRSGKVEQLLVSEGQAVTAGETLGFII